uniref:Putative DNA binding, helix-turn-helix domain containing protein n=1 Tax=viral metagenome TaxID=1070528 RepID=A0A6M3LCX6_9ZZZZ
MNLTTGQRIRLARLGNRWTLNDVADHVGVSITYLSKIENDYRSVPDKVFDLFRLGDPIWFDDLIELIEITSKDLYSVEEIDQIIDSLKNALKL